MHIENEPLFQAGQIALWGVNHQRAVVRKVSEPEVIPVYDIPATSDTRNGYDYVIQLEGTTEIFTVGEHGLSSTPEPEYFPNF